MNLRRTTHIILTSLARAAHRHGFGVQSPSDYELIRDVLFEPLHYYAYEEQGLNTPLERQLFRIQNHFRGHPIEVVKTTISNEANDQIQLFMKSPPPDAILVIEHIDDENAESWDRVVADPKATVTFDMGRRGLATFDPKRIKQNYLL